MTIPPVVDVVDVVDFVDVVDCVIGHGKASFGLLLCTAKQAGVGAAICVELDKTANDNDNTPR